LKKKLLKIFFIFLIILIQLPLISLIFSTLGFKVDTILHISENLLPKYLSNTLYLFIGVAVVMSIVSLPLAYLVARFQFPFRNYFEWGFLIPLSIPSYIFAYIFYQNKSYFPSLNSTFFASVIFTLSLYPYVYLFCKNAFMSIPKNLEYAAKSLGSTKLSVFFKIQLPIILPSFFSGIILVFMEVLADFGTVDFFSIDTIATGIFRVWSATGDTASASFLSLILFCISLLFLFYDNKLKSKISLLNNTDNQVKLNKLNGISGFLAFLYCFTIFLVSFILPFLYTVYKFYEEGWKHLNKHFLQISAQTFLLAFSSALLCTLISIFITYLIKINSHKDKLFNIGKLNAIGYSLPGSLIAIGIVINLAELDKLLNFIFHDLLNLKDIHIYTLGSYLALNLAYLTRFSAISHNCLSSQLGLINNNLYDASKTLNQKEFSTFRCIYFPLLKRSILASFLITFLDIIKELPAAMILRPFNFDTLAIEAYNLASDERFTEATPSILLIIVTALIPIIGYIFLQRFKKNEF
jgi:iron(III) transport system permease protein